MEFRRTFFDPAEHGGETSEDGSTVTFSRDGSHYVYSDEIMLAVNLAMATDRPLLVTGAPGSGKSTLARNIAHVLDRKYYVRVITSRTRAQDLQWRFDALRRLSDAQRQGVELPQRAEYIDPEVLWWSFDPEDAKHYGHDDPAAPARTQDSVVLLDEVDKAEPDVPNDLLDLLDLLRFEVLDLDEPVVVKAKHDVFLIMTTNGERDLPPAFIRRCVVLTLPDPETDWLVAIADDRFGPEDHDLHFSVAEEVEALRRAAKRAGLREPSTAEYLDVLTACKELGGDTEAKSWERVRRALLWKHEESTPQTE